MASRTLREARGEFFSKNGFSLADYAKAWTELRLGPIPVYVPNTRSRRRAVPTHDLHHVLTGYETSLLGEAEIGAWELASGCKDYGAAWFYNAIAASIGLLLDRRRVLRAFARGLRCANLYGRSVEALLERDVEELRRELGLS